jgi:hypothetical protein
MNNRIEIAIADITKLEVDAIVNAANCDRVLNHTKIYRPEQLHQQSHLRLLW